MFLRREDVFVLAYFLLLAFNPWRLFFQHTQFICIFEQRCLPRQLSQRLFDSVYLIRDGLWLPIHLLLLPSQNIFQPLQPRLEQREREQNGLFVVVHVVGLVVCLWNADATIAYLRELFLAADSCWLG